MARHFCIWIVSPPGYLHSRCFEEMALGLRAAFAELGYDAPIVTRPEEISDYAVVLGTHLLTTVTGTLPPHLILYNLEQIQKGSTWISQEYLNLLKRYPVWDYSALNIQKLKECGIKDVTLCGIGYMPALTCIPPAPEDIDVLFIGSQNPRRMAILQQIAAHGKTVLPAFNAYGKERDALIARAKIVLNLHYYEAQIFEIVRVSYLLANHKCVVSETGFDSDLEAPLREGIAFVPYEDLTNTCLHLLQHAPERRTLAEKGFACFSSLSQTTFLKRALAGLL